LQSGGGLEPGALAQDVVQVQGDVTLLNQTLNLLLVGIGQDPHQGLGGEPVLGTLLVVTLGHVGEHLVGGLVDVVDDLAKVGLEVSLGEILQVGESCRGNVPFPLEVALAFIDHGLQVGVISGELGEGLGELELVARDGAASSGQSQVLLSILRARLPGQVSGLPHVGSEDNQVEVLVDVVHDLGLQEGLGSVIHDLVAELGLGNVLSQLLDASSTSLWGSRHCQ